jgi:DNA-binding response OmpR family regulator
MNAAGDKSAPVALARSGAPAKQKILLVDDDPAIRQILCRLLTEEEYSVLTAANGVEALGLVDTTELDLIVLDLNMPVKDGWETCNQLCVKNPLLPVILITGRPNQYFSAVASGVSALLEKPLDFLKLLSTIQTLLKESTEARQAGHNARPTTFCYVPWTP